MDGIPPPAFTLSITEQRPLPRSNRTRTARLVKTIFRLYARLVHCPQGRHERSRGRVHKVGEQYRSRCSNCGRPMVRLAKRTWVIDERHS